MTLLNEISTSIRSDTPSIVESVARLSDSSAAKVLRMLDAFAGLQSVFGVTELAEKVQLPKSTAHRLLGILTEGKYVKRVGDRYALTDRVFELGHRVSNSRPNGLRERAMPYIADLYAETRETVHLAVLQGVEVLYLEKLFGPTSVRSGTMVGTRRKAHATALGKAMLAGAADDLVERALREKLSRYTPYTQVIPGRLERLLARTKEQGFAIDQEETLLGMVCVAAPIRDLKSGDVLGAVSISAHASTDAVRKLSPKVVKAAAQISRQLGSTTFA
ncbi:MULTISPECIES: IclR family transcriptional regulator [unclassified Rhodococcus (in: high G+C Gram-positive bacteria)]|uniref:IclR family transcriptional regulator n=1 Tax=unclassified Rhodococcus (in: high G+C Gram-positive bacteria) TaxID=192944 RepID=UPI00052ADC34|nr:MULTISPECIES: IclR family transcriptional regulator [unclassified Rhodococcus (in: high G+C Gram-positive bacteria)]AIW42801.1 putative transcriptional regulator [Rhodococcus sp. YL-1]